MLKQEHWKWFTNLLFRGANTDVEPEFKQDGSYRDAHMMRPSSVDGTSGSMNKVRGEVEFRPSSQDEEAVASQYVCIGAVVISGRHVSFWASTNTDLPVIIKINGVTMVRSMLIPYRWDRELRFGPVDRCPNGILFPVDGESDMLFWDISAIEDAYNEGSLAFFEEFTIESVLVIPPFQVEWPRFRGLLNAGSGLPTGTVQYYIRGVLSSGDRTNAGPMSPQISIPAYLDDMYVNPANGLPYIYPGCRTIGGPTNTEVTTPYHVLLEFRSDNQFGLSEYEIVRRSFTNGEGLNGAGQDVIVARIPVPETEFGIVQYQDPQDSNFFEVIPSDQVPSQNAEIYGAKGVEHVDNRVIYANFKRYDRVADFEFRTGPDGRAMIPITERLVTRRNGEEYNTGHNDPLNLAYKRSARRGEKYGHAIMPWSPSGAKGFCIPIPGAENLQMPNRRDKKDGDSLRYSSDSLWAANTDTTGAEQVSATYEAFEQGLQKRTDTSTIIDVLANSGTYRPFQPVRPDDPDPSNSGWNIPPQTERYLNDSVSSPDSGFIFNQRHHALGGMMYGINSMPSWVKAFSVMRTDPADRVVAQGMGFYSLIGGAVGDAIATKHTDRLSIHFPDFENNLVLQSIINRLTDDTNGYGIQLVAPYGYYSDVFTFDAGLALDEQEAFGADILAYANVIHDEGQVNVGEPGPGGMGTQPGVGSSAPNGNYVTWQKWRSTDPGTLLSCYTQPDKGNHVFPIRSIQQSVQYRTRFWVVRTDEYIYPPETFTTSGSTDFNAQSVRKFSQPVYLVNIVKLGADVAQENTKRYKDTFMHVKVESCIGIMPDPTSETQSFRLVNERVDDVRPYGTGTTVDDLRYVWVQQPGQPQRAWLCITDMVTNFFTAVEVLDAIQDPAGPGYWLSPDGTQVYGIYQTTTDDTDTYVVFGAFSGSQLPFPGSRIFVRYNPKAGVRFFGYDNVISRQVFCVYDGAYNRFGSSTTLQLSGLPLPYQGVVRSPNYVVPVGSSVSEDAIPFVAERLVSARQICVMWDAETKYNGIMDLWNSLDVETHHRSGYVVRPMAIGSYTTGAANGLSGQWDVDYPNAATQLNSGGIRFIHAPLAGEDRNLDYSKSPLFAGVGLPLNGERPRTDMCTAYAASLKSDQVLIDTPGLRTFLESNIFQVSEECGPINMIVALNQSGDQRLFGWCETGVHYVPYNKNILSNADGTTLGTQEIGQFWPRGEQWMARGNKGLPDQFWRFAVVANAPAGQQDADSVIWADRNGVYRLTGGAIKNILRDKYSAKLLSVLRSVPGGHGGRYSGVHVDKYGEAWMTIDGTVYVYSTAKDEWIGTFSYLYDRYVFDDSGIYGFRDLAENELDVGYLVFSNGRWQPYECWVETTFAPYPARRTELVSWRAAPDKPDEVRVYDRDHALMLTMNEAINGPFWAKFVDSYQQLMGRTDDAYGQGRRRVQDTMFFMRYIHRSEEPFRITFAEAQAKLIA